MAASLFRYNGKERPPKAVIFSDSISSLTSIQNGESSCRQDLLSSVLAKTGSSSLQSHIACTQNIRKIKQLKKVHRWEGGISIPQDIWGSSRKREILSLSNSV